MISLSLLFSHLSGICFIYNEVIKGKEEKGELTPNAKDIGVVYLMFALLSVLVGIISLVLINLELVVASLEYILYNNLDYLLIVQLLIKKPKLNPWWITGFVDGEGCFSVTIRKDKKYKSGWVISPVFKISLHDKDIALLELIQTLLGVGKIYKHGNDSVQLRVASIKELEVIIDYLDSYPLITQKWSDYELFKQALLIIKNKEHLTMEGLEKLMAIKAAMNRGLSESLKAEFPDIIPVLRPQVENQMIPDPNWLAGFASGEGCFYVGISKSSDQTGLRVQLEFILTQHIRDELLMKSLIDYFNCGRLSRKIDVYEFQVSKFSDIVDKILVFFDKYPILGEKAKDFEDFKKVAELIKSKVHLTEKGKVEIREIKKGMNRGRKS